MRAILLFGAVMAAGGASAADGVAACDPWQAQVERADGAILCVSEVTVGGATSRATPAASTLIGPALAWTAATSGLRVSRDRARTSLPGTLTVGGFVALAPGLDAALRFDGSQLVVRLDGMERIGAADVLASNPPIGRLTGIGLLPR